MPIFARLKHRRPTTEPRPELRCRSSHDRLVERSEQAQLEYFKLGMPVAR